MRTNLRHTMLPAIAGCAITLAARNVFGLGGDYPNDRIVDEPSWPIGMKNLANTTNRVGGLFVNDRDTFFFSGTVSNFNNFLGDYSKIQTIEKHQLILHEGVGEAYSLGGGNRRPCDWNLDGYGNGWKNGIMTNYVLEVHFWTGGKIDVNQLKIPNNVEVAGDCLKNFESITNGMTRGEVKQRLEMDGGLTGVSPVRFIDPKCPGFKITVDFDFKKDAADQGRAIIGKDDKVIHVSKPYLERPFSD